MSVNMKARISPTSAANSTPKNTSPNRDEAQRWIHTPSAVVVIWLLFSIPLVLWDAGYVLLRPHSMPGGKLHSPIWTPYALYGTIDYIYGFPALEAGNGFTAAQAFLNLVETSGNIFYLYTVYRYGVSIRDSGRGYSKPRSKSILWLLKSPKAVVGRRGAIALLIGFSASIMTTSKTVLYCKYIPYDFATIAERSQG